MKEPHANMEELHLICREVFGCIGLDDPQVKVKVSEHSLAALEAKRRGGNRAALTPCPLLQKGLSGFRSQSPAGLEKFLVIW